jgi:putative transferase (TIGR04331 family)
LLHLITTADERTYNFEKSVLFLGEWCKPYQKKNIWLKYNTITAEPFGIGLENKKSNISIVQNLHKEFIKLLSARFNEINNTNFSERYYNILLGHWLYRYLCVLFNRFYTIEQTFSKYKISSTSRIEFGYNYDFATNDSQDFLNIVNDDLWNHNLYLRIIEFIGYDISINTIKSQHNYESLNKPNSSVYKKIKSTLIFIYNNCSKLFIRNTDAFIINSYLPRFEELKFQIALFQFPVLWRSPKIPYFEKNSGLRHLANNFISKEKNFENFAKSLLFEMIPKCYLEGSVYIMSECQKINWPKYPKFILTSNNFDTDEFFKYWTASKVDQGFSYYVCQHGNNYGTYFGNDNWPERVTPDRFITWGWSSLNSNTTKGFNFKIVKKIKFNSNKSDKIYLILLHQPYRCHPEDNYFEFTQYQEDQFCFVQAISNEVKSNLLIRLHSSSINFNWSETQRWKDLDDKLNIIKSDVSFHQILLQSRVLVFSYDSTGFLEALMLNKPTIAFWREENNNLIYEVNEYYNELKEAKILFSNPAAAAEFISDNWNKIDDWWSSDFVQYVRTKFCNEFSKFENKPIRKLLEIINNHD